MAQDRDRELGSQALAGALQSSFRLLQYAMGGMVIYIFCTGAYVVNPDEEVVVFRLGKIVGTKADQIREPGLHLGCPYPVDEIVRVPTKILSVRSDTHWYWLNDAEKEAVRAGEDPGPGAPTLRPLVDGYMITGDVNILHSQWELRYRISDSVRYACDFAERGTEIGISSRLEAMLTSALDNAVIMVAARYETDAAHRTEVDQFRADVESKVSEIIVRQNLGCVVERVEPKKVAPPRRVKRAFEAVLRAEQEQDKLRKEAGAFKSGALGDAEAKASEIVAQAQAQATGTVKRAQADAQAFAKLYPRYKDNPMVVRKTLWLDTLSRVMDNVDEKMLVHKGQELRLQLGRDPKVLAKQSREAIKGENTTTEEEGAPASDGHDEHNH